MKLWKRIKIYKNLLLAVWTANLIVIFTGLVFIVFHYSDASKFEFNIKKQISKVTELDTILSELQQFEAVKEWSGQNWLQLGRIKSRVESLGLSEAQSLEQAFNTQTPHLTQIRASLQAEKAEAMSELSMSLPQMGRYRYEIVFIALASVILGVIIPLILIWRLKVKTMILRARVENQVIESLKTWREHSAKYRDRPEQSSKFWVDMALLTLGQVGKEIDHPLAYYASQLSYRILQETQGPDLKNDLENKEQLS